jgi:Fe-S-cluster containining protein
MKKWRFNHLYSTLLANISSYESRLLDKYGEHIKCGKSCSSCCILETVFPVEAYIISSAVIDSDDNDLSLFTETPGRCVFLRDSYCSIYHLRPVICRTHGYPVFIDGETDFCPENFHGISSIGSEYVIDLENLNSTLASINIIFRGEVRDRFFLQERVSMKDLKKYIIRHRSSGISS